MKKTSPLSLLVFCVLAVPNVFADVVMLKAGFSQIAGAAAGTAREISIRTSDGVRSIPIDQVFSIRFGSAETVPAASPLPAPASPAAAATVRSITLPAGTPISVRTIDAIDSKTGDTYREYAASLDEPVVVNQVTVAPTKVSAVLKIAEIKQAGRLKGSTTLSLRLIAVIIDGQRVGLETGDVVSASSGKGKTTIRDGAIGTAAGCGIGAAVGGAVGCGVGGAVGGAIGASTSALLGKDVKIAPETRLTFKLAQPAAVPAATSPTADHTETPLAAALRRGEAHMKANESTAALKEYEAAVEINGRSSLAHYNIGLIYLQQKNLQSAVDELNEASRGDLDPKWVVVWIHVRLGQIFDQMDQRDRAINEYIQAVQTGDNTYAAQYFATGYLRTPCREGVCPDTLTLRNGTSVTGNWLSMGDDKVQFLTDDRPQTYSKSDVLVVTFGSVPNVAAAPGTVACAPPAHPESAPPGALVCGPSVPVKLQATQPVYGPEPEWVGAVYFRDASGSFTPLERSATRTLQARYPMTYNLNLMVVEGPKSPVRLKQSEKTAFVVRLANGIDPRVFTLYPMDANSKGRGAATDKKTKSYKTILVNVTRVGASSYGLTPENALSTGEYCFIPKNSTDAYCFGLDAH
jgi:hypothetical protein